MRRESGETDPRNGGRRGIPWYAWPIPDVLDRLACTEGGLTGEEAARRLGMVGPNRLPVKRLMPAPRLLREQFLSVGSGLLALAVVLALLGDRRLEAGILSGILLLNVVVGFAVQLRRRAVVSRRIGVEGPGTVVLRDGRRSRIDHDGIVPGDVIEVFRGERVPADARLLVAEEVRVDEAVLSGDSTPVEKVAQRPSGWDDGLGYRASMLYSGSFLTHGRARAVVTGTGGSTRAARRGRPNRSLEKRTVPIEADVAALLPRMAGITLLLSGAAIGTGLVGDRGTGWILEAGLSLAVAAVPVALPVVTILVTALALQRMASHEVVCQHSGVLRALSSATVICADATRTLTSVPAAVGQVVTSSSRGVGPALEPVDPLTTGGGGAGPSPDTELQALLRAVVLTLPPPAPPGEITDPRDMALQRLLLDRGLDREEGAWAVSPSDGRRYDPDEGVTTVQHREGTALVAYVRGSSDVILARSGSFFASDGARSLDPARRAAIEAEHRSLEARGMEVLAFAHQPSASRLDATDRSLVYVGAVGIEAPPALHIAEAVSTLSGAGVRAVFLTPERAEYGEAVARHAWIPLDAGSVGQWPALPDAGASTRSGTASGAAVIGGVPRGRSRPVVAALKDTAGVVGLVAHDSADPSSFEEADLTIAPAGRGGGTSRIAPDVIVGEAGFTAIPEAVRRGRVALDIIARSTRYLLGCSLAILVLLSVTAFSGLPLPLTPLQVIWLNLVAVFLPALVLALEPGDANAMRRPPGNPLADLGRPRGLVRLSADALPMAAVAVAAFVLTRDPGSPARAATVAFTTMALAQLLHLWTMRSREPAVGHRRGAVVGWFTVAVAIGVTLHLVALSWPPLTMFLRAVPLGASDWGLALGLAVTSALVGWMIRDPRTVSRGRRADPANEPAADVEDGPERSLLLQEVRLLTRAEARSLGSGFVSSPARPFDQALSALEAGDMEGLRGLVARFPELVHTRDRDGTLLHHAARLSIPSGRANAGAAVSVLVRGGADPDAGERSDGSGRTPLIEAVRIDNASATRALLELGADPDRGEGLGHGLDTPLGHALLCGRDPGQGGSQECASILVEAGCQVSPPLAAALGRTNSLAEMLAHASAEDRRRALIFAAHRGQAEAVRTCLDAGADPSTPTLFFEDRLTPLHAAAGRGRLGVVRLLLDAGADPGVEDGRLGATPSEWAQQAGHAAVVSLLLDASSSRI